MLWQTQSFLSKYFNIILTHLFSLSNQLFGNSHFRTKVIKGILLLIVFLTPLLKASFGLGYEEIKVFFFNIAVLVCFLIFLFHISVDKKVDVTLSPIAKAGLIFIGWVCIASLFGTNPVISFFGINPYYQGVIFFIFLFLFYLVVKFVKFV